MFLRPLSPSASVLGNRGADTITSSHAEGLPNDDAAQSSFLRLGPITPRQSREMGLERYENPQVQEFHVVVSGIPICDKTSRTIWHPSLGVAPARLPELVRMSLNGVLCAGDLSRIQALSLNKNPMHRPFQGYQAVMPVLATARALRVLVLEDYLLNAPSEPHLQTKATLDLPCLQHVIVKDKAFNIRAFLRALTTVPPQVFTVAKMSGDESYLYRVFSYMLPEGYFRRPPFKDVDCITVQFTHNTACLNLAIGSKINASFGVFCDIPPRSGAFPRDMQIALLRSLSVFLKDLRLTKFVVMGVHKDLGFESWQDLLQSVSSIRELCVFPQAAGSLEYFWRALKFSGCVDLETITVCGSLCTSQALDTIADAIFGRRNPLVRLVLTVVPLAVCDGKGRFVKTEKDAMEDARDWAKMIQRLKLAEKVEVGHIGVILPPRNSVYRSAGGIAIPLP